MNRRTFSKSIAVAVSTIGLHGVSSFALKPAPQFSITMDDFHWNNPVKLTAWERNRSILDALKANSIKGALFVVGRNIESGEGKQLLSSWDSAGHLIGNHTYSHRNYNAAQTRIDEYQQDILRAEALLKDFPSFQKYFRFPMLKEGDTAARRSVLLQRC